MKKDISAVFACVGAIVGAGFASGREVIVFFTRYGTHSWWLIVLTGAVITWLCSMCMHGGRQAEAWIGLFGSRKLPVMVSCGLMIITAGAMIAAAGRMAALLWIHEWAYALGGAATLFAAWMVSGKSVHFLGWISAFLSILLVCVLICALRSPVQDTVIFKRESSVYELASAAACTAAYAAMNILLALGVVSQCAGCGKWVPVGAGLTISLLLGMSNALYIRYPEMIQADFPLIVLLNRQGRAGYLLGIVLLYLSIFTTLSAVILALRTVMNQWFVRPGSCMALTLGLPLAVSCAGFSGVVDNLYAPVGLICLLTVFVPLRIRQRAVKRALDF